MAWQCPDCGESDHLQVSILTSGNLTQSDDNFETEIEGDHEWDNDSSMWCTACGNIGTAGQFECNLPIHPVNPCGPMPNNITLPPYGRRRTDV